MERTTITLDPDLARALRQRAHDTRRPFKDGYCVYRGRSGATGGIELDVSVGQEEEA